LANYSIDLHILFTADESGNEKNGTFVNGIRVSRQKLKNGDIIGIGRGRDLREGDHIAEKNLEVVAALHTFT
jgi:pSer/pThr/pTyr-binding forkhead associated (FHA) protein